MVLGGPGWARLPGGEQASVFFGRARPAKQQKTYDRWVQFWVDFNAVGDGWHPYDALVFTLAKWYLFAGYLWNYTEDRDLNKVRSALNRHFADNRRGRPLLGVDVNKVIKVWGEEMDAKKRGRGEQVGCVTRLGLVTQRRQLASLHLERRAGGLPLVAFGARRVPRVAHPGKPEAFAAPPAVGPEQSTIGAAAHPAGAQVLAQHLRSAKHQKRAGCSRNGMSPRR